MPELPEPTAAGAVVRVETDRSRYPEIWIASNINIGRWYPDSESWLTSSARHDHPNGCDWYELGRRGKVTLLTDGNREMYVHGWRAGARAAANAAEGIEHEHPPGPEAETTTPETAAPSENPELKLMPVLYLVAAEAPRGLYSIWVSYDQDAAMACARANDGIVAALPDVVADFAPTERTSRGLAEAKNKILNRKEAP